MATNSATKKLTQITEESLAPVQIPLIIGTDCYMVTQQDIRRVEDIRYFCFNKINQNGVMNPADSIAAEFLFTILKTINTSVNSQKTDGSPQPMEVSSNPNYASIEQQLKWDKCTNMSAPFAFNYSRGTSTTDLRFSTTEVDVRTLSSSNYNPCYRSKTVKFTKGTNTNEMENTNTPSLDAREQLRQRKIVSSHIS